MATINAEHLAGLYIGASKRDGLTFDEFQKLITFFQKKFATKHSDWEIDISDFNNFNQEFLHVGKTGIILSYGVKHDDLVAHYGCLLPTDVFSTALLATMEYSKPTKHIERRNGRKL